MHSAGFVDAQVNGGNGRILKDEPSAASMYMIADGHRRYGATSLLPTLITDTADATTAAIESAAQAVREIAAWRVFISTVRNWRLPARVHILPN